MPPVGTSFLGRMLQLVADELIVDRLANNPTFQRFAVRTARAVEGAAEHSERLKAEALNQISEFTASMRDEVSRSFKDASQRSGRSGTW